MDTKNDFLLPIGSLLKNGTYCVEKYLSSGGFGKTYVVSEVSKNGHVFAMKEFFMKGINLRKGTEVSVSTPDNKTSFDSQKRKFQKEAQRLKAIHHPNIVGVYDSFEENGTCYYIMDYIDGESLAQKLEKDMKPLSVNEVINILYELLDALDEVHKEGITHLDLKPGNIMQDKQGCAYLIDFGASKQWTSEENHTLSTSTAMPYTEGYAPMEQVERELKNVGPWTDLYALGATIYKLLTLNQPPKSTTIFNEPDDAFDFSKVSNKDVQKLIIWLMTPQRKRRPQSVEEVRDYLKEHHLTIPANSKTNYQQNGFVEKKSRNNDPQASEETIIKTKNDASEVTTYDQTNNEKRRRSSNEETTYSQSIVSVVKKEDTKNSQSDNIRSQAAQKTYVEVKSVPTNASVSIDGKWVGTTPNIFEVAPGRHEIKVKDSFWNVFTKSIGVAKGETFQVYAQLTQETYINVKSDPSGADIYIDGNWRGVTPNKIKTTQGEHDLKLSKGSNWYPYIQFVNVAAGQTVDVYATLEQIKTNNETGSKVGSQVKNKRNTTSSNTSNKNEYEGIGWWILTPIFFFFVYNIFAKNVWGINDDAGLYLLALPLTSFIGFGIAVYLLAELEWDEDIMQITGSIIIAFGVPFILYHLFDVSGSSIVGITYVLPMFTFPFALILVLMDIVNINRNNCPKLELIKQFWISLSIILLVIIDEGVYVNMLVQGESYRFDFLDFFPTYFSLQFVYKFITSIFIYIIILLFGLASKGKRRFGYSFNILSITASILTVFVYLECVYNIYIRLMVEEQGVSFLTE